MDQSLRKKVLFLEIAVFILSVTVFGLSLRYLQIVDYINSICDIISSLADSIDKSISFDRKLIVLLEQVAELLESGKIFLS